MLISFHGPYVYVCVCVLYVYIWLLSSICSNILLVYYCLYFRVVRVLCFWIQVQFYTCVLRKVLPVCSMPFISLGFFNSTNTVSFNKFYHFVCLACVLNYFPIPHSQRLSPVFSSRTFIVLSFIFDFFTHFKIHFTFQG